MLAYDSWRSTDQEGYLADFRLVIFQSLTTLEAPVSNKGQRQRFEEDDLHLQRVLDQISPWNGYRDPEYPKWIIPCPRYQASDYPSSWSKDI